MKNNQVETLKRLDAVKSLVPKGTRLLDIGTDHASLPIELVKSNIITTAIASDINIKPLNRATEEIKKNNLSNKIKTVLSNGFENIEEGSFDCAAICGMGGHLIAEIIEKGDIKAKNCFLILQPMSYPEALRKYLFDNGFEIYNEIFAFENNKTYVIILSKYTGIISEYTYQDLVFGKIRPQNEYFDKYIHKIKKRLQKRLIGIIKHKIENYNNDLTR